MVPGNTEPHYGSSNIDHSSKSDDVAVQERLGAEFSIRFSGVCDAIEISAHQKRGVNMTYKKPVVLAVSNVDKRRLRGCASQHTCFTSCQTRH